MQRLPFLSVVLNGVLLWSALTQPAFSQTAEKQEPTGTVIGHVYCADTNGPARLARVMLEPVNDVSKAARPGNTTLSSMNSVQSELDGSFTMKDVKPGTYYVIAEMPGYLSSLSGLSEEDWEHPTASVVERMAKTLQQVTVEAGKTAVVNLSLERGAAVSGTVSFDDGSPAVGVHIKALREKSDGSWDTVRLDAIQPFLYSGITTNDLGQYRIAGLGAGHYVIRVEVSISKMSVTGFMGQSMGMSENSRYSLSFFSGGQLRASKDSAFALAAGESRPGEDIVIPLSKLHSVSGSVIRARDGLPVAAGSVSLLYGDDETTLATVMLDSASGEYRFYFVPEGHFILKVDAEKNSMRMSKNSLNIYHYPPLQEPLDVHGDIDGLVLTIPEPTAKPTTAQNSRQPQ